MSFKDRLRELRTNKNLTQDDLAQKLNIPSSTIRRYETDDNSMPKFERLENLADFFNCSVDYILGRNATTSLGLCLKSARQSKGYTQLQVAELLGIHNKTLSGYETGISEPSLDTLKLLANLYDVTISYLAGSDEYSKLTESDMHLLQAFHRLDKRDQETMLDLITRIGK